MSKHNYDPVLFLNRLKERIKNMPPCPICQHNDFSVMRECAPTTIQTSFSGLEIGKTMPCGIVYCTNCGHVDYFVLGVYNMVPNRKGDYDAR